MNHSPSSDSSKEGEATFPITHRIFRLVWSVTWFFLCRWTPPAFWPWRRLVLRAFGARLDRCDVRGGAKIWYPPNLEMKRNSIIADGVNCYNVALVRIGEYAVVSQDSHLCTASHKISDPDFPLIVSPILIEEHAWVAAEAFVGPGVVIGAYAVLGARGAAFESLESKAVYRGNPAQKIKNRSIS